MHKFAVEHAEGKIVSLLLLDVIATEVRPILVGTDEEARAKLIKERAGETISLDEFWSICGLYTPMRVVLTPCGPTYLTDSAILVDPDVALWESWRSGKYMIDGGAVVPDPNWVEPMIRLGTLDRQPVFEDGDAVEAEDLTARRRRRSAKGGA